MRALTFLIPFAIMASSAFAQFGDSIVLENGDVATLGALLTEERDPTGLQSNQNYAAEKISSRKFDNQRWREVVEGHDYDGSSQKRESEQTSGDGSGRSGRREADEDDEEADSSTDLGWLGPLAPLIFYGTIAAVIVVILIQVAKNISSKPNIRKNSISKPGEEFQNIADLDTEPLLQKAQASGDYKLAIRLYFLQLLKILNESGKISWTKDKTNRDYLSELFSKQFHFDEIKKLTLAYERIWYGEHLPSTEVYLMLSREFESLEQRLNTGNRS